MTQKAQKSNIRTGAAVSTESSLRYWRSILSGAAINPYRLLEMATAGTVNQSAVNSTSVIGVNTEAYIASGKTLQNSGIVLGPCVFVADQAIVAGQRLKAAAAGRVIQLVDAALTGTTIKATTAGGNGGNQPANDGVELVSSNAGDTTQTATIIGTTNGTDTIVVEDVLLTGTSVASTVKTDWGVIVAVKLSASCAGTITVREASGDATITTITTGNLSKGVNTVSSTGTTQYAYNAIPTAVAGGASTKTLGLKGIDSSGTTIYDSKALNGTTAVTFNSAFRTITEVYDLDLATATVATVKVGAADTINASIGKALESASAQGDLLNGFCLPQ